MGSVSTSAVVASISEKSGTNGSDVDMEAAELSDEEGNGEEATGMRQEANATGSSDIDQPSNEGRTKRSPKPIERYEAGPASGKRSKKESVAPAAQPDVGVTGTHGDTEWTQVVSGSDNRKIVRIMEFAKDSITAYDPQGRLCSLWCLEKGYIACANRVVPEKFLTDQDGALGYLREEQEDLIKAKCLESPLFSDGTGHLWQYLLFARLRPGDLVILQLKAGGHAPGEAVFGFIEDDSFIIKTKKQILKEEKFPWKFLANRKIGVWHKINSKICTKLRGKNFNIESRLFFEKLMKFGYFVNTSKKNELKKIVSNFQRRFRPELVDGKIERECFEIAKSLISSK